jgi:CheY-like chemotaxis protein
VNTVLLIHWNEAEAQERVERLREAAYAPLTLTSSANAPVILKRLLEKPIDAIVIDLSRLPSHGRDVGIALRSKKTTRHIPIVFVDGEPEKISRVKTVLPDAVFTEWSKIGAAVKSAIKNRPANPLVPNTMAGYSGTPLPKKLGIKPGIVLALINAPDAFERTLDPLPDEVTIKEDLRGKTDLVVLFASRMADIFGQFPRAERSLNDGGKLWIAWPKQASGVKTDVTQPAVREFGLAAGWVDFKVCAIDETWSGLAFARRDAKAKRVAR